MRLNIQVVVALVALAMSGAVVAAGATSSGGGGSGVGGSHGGGASSGGSHGAGSGGHGGGGHGGFAGHIGMGRGSFSHAMAKNAVASHTLAKIEPGNPNHNRLPTRHSDHWMSPPVFNGCATGTFASKGSDLGYSCGRPVKAAIDRSTGQPIG
jgi:hypothetical protein